MYPVVDLSHNNIQGVDESLCDRTSGDGPDRFEQGKSTYAKEKRLLYIDLSHNNLTSLSARALDCGDIYLLLNINHNPISVLPELPKKQYRLTLLSAANTSVEHIPKSYSATDNLFALKSIFINSTYDISPLSETGRSAKLWDCCEILQLTRVAEGSSLKCVNVDMVSERTDLISSDVLGVYSVYNQKCRFQEKVMGFGEFARNLTNDQRDRVCKGVDLGYARGDADIAFVLVITMVLVLLYFIAFLLSQFADSIFEEKVSPPFQKSNPTSAFPFPSFTCMHESFGRCTSLGDGYDRYVCYAAKGNEGESTSAVDSEQNQTPVTFGLTMGLYYMEPIDCL
eukprot:Nk52_evm12s160 gene=Nk52_evmTU12s160